LAISFSATDLIAHTFGPSSLESEDNLLRLDGVLHDLFAYVDQTVGLKNTLIVLSGDHGGPEYPELLKRFKIDTGWISEETIKNAATEALSKKYPSVSGLISTYSHPYFYLDHNVIAKNPPDEVKVDLLVAHG